MHSPPHISNELFGSMPAYCAEHLPPVSQVSMRREGESSGDFFSLRDPWTGEWKMAIIACGREKLWTEITGGLQFRVKSHCQNSTGEA